MGWNVDVKAGAGAASLDYKLMEMEAVHSKATGWKDPHPWVLKGDEPLAGPEHLHLSLHLS